MPTALTALRPLIERPDLPTPAAGDRRPWLWRAMRPAGLGILAAGWATDNPVLVLLALVVATWLLLRRWLPTDVALPSAVLLLTSSAVVLGLVAHLVGLDLLARPVLLLGVHVVYCAIPVLLPDRGPSAALRPQPYGGGARVAYLPAVALLLVGLRQAFDERLAASWSLLGTDVARHMLYVQGLQQDGALEYTSDGYPRGLHMLLALASVPGRALDEPASALVYDLRLVAAATVLAFALLVSTAICLTLRVASCWGWSQLLAVLSGLGTGLLLLGLSSYVRAFIVQAAAPSLLAAVALWALPLTALVLRKHRHRLLALLLVAAGCTALLAQLWQALVLVPPAAAVLCVALRLRRPRELLVSLLPARGASVLVVAGVVVAVVVTLLPILSLQASGGGLAVASTVGESPGPPRALLVAALLSALVVPFLSRHDALRHVLLAQVLALLLVCALLLRATDNPLDLGQYYPQKVQWFLLVLLLPVLVLGAVDVLARLVRRTSTVLGRLGRAARVARAVTVSVTFALLFAFVLPYFVLDTPVLLSVARVNERSGDAVRRLDLALEHGHRHAPTIPVPVSIGTSDLPDRVATPLVSTLLAFQTGQPTNYGQPAQVCSDIELVAQGQPAVVVTALDAAYLRRLMSRRGCGDVPIVQVPGGGAHPMFLPKD